MSFSTSMTGAMFSNLLNMYAIPALTRTWSSIPLYDIQLDTLEQPTLATVPTRSAEEPMDVDEGWI